MTVHTKHLSLIFLVICACQICACNDLSIQQTRFSMNQSKLGDQPAIKIELAHVNQLTMPPWMSNQQKCPPNMYRAWNLDIKRTIKHRQSVTCNDQATLWVHNAPTLILNRRCDSSNQILKDSNQVTLTCLTQDGHSFWGKGKEVWSSDTHHYAQLADLTRKFQSSKVLHCTDRFLHPIKDLLASDHQWKPLPVDDTSRLESDLVAYSLAQKNMPTQKNQSGISHSITKLNGTGLFYRSKLVQLRSNATWHVKDPSLDTPMTIYSSIRLELRCMASPDIRVQKLNPRE